MKTRWIKIEDVRDPAYGDTTYEVAELPELENELGEITRSDLPPLPAGAVRVWRSGRRWLAR